MKQPPPGGDESARANHAGVRKPLDLVSLLWNRLLFQQTSALGQKQTFSNPLPYVRFRG